MIKLNLGSKHRKLPGFDNLDQIFGWHFQDGLFQYSNSSVEGITISHAVMFLTVSELEQFIQEVKRVLCYGGVIRITEDDTENPASRWYKTGNLRSGPKCLTGPKMIRNIFEKAGFLVYDVEKNQTNFSDDSLIQAYRGGEPDVFFIEAVKSSDLPTPFLKKDTSSSFETIHLPTPTLNSPFQLSPPFGSFMPALIQAIQHSDGPVLELGMGLFSTPYLHYSCLPSRKLVSYESDPVFFEQFKLFQSDLHQLHLVDDWDQIDLSGHWGVVLIDHEPTNRRKIEVERLANSADYIVIHDSNPRLERKYRYSEIYPLFKYRKDFNQQKPYTTILSNFKDLSELDQLTGQAVLPKTTTIAGFQAGHDISYCILDNGVPILCEEQERISRIKMELGDGLKLLFERYSETERIDYFAFGNWGNRKGRAAQRCVDQPSQDKMQQLLDTKQAEYFEFGHHISHGANAFYTSDFDEALIITMDGGGNEDDHLRTALTISKGHGNQIERITTFPISQLDLGGIWHFATKEIFRLSNGYPKGDQAGTVMAMASLGKPVYKKLFASFYEKSTNKTLRALADSSEEERFNVAASLQSYTEELFQEAVAPYILGYQNLCLSGGVSLNCVLTGKIRQWFPNIKNIFCDPVPYDAGTALGAARYLWHQVLGNPRIKTIANQSPFLGQSYDESAIRLALKSYSDKIKIYKKTDTDVLSYINEQKIVSVFGGKSECGRRALGNRSILADPRNPDMKKLINQKVKHRQWYRPLAPAILEEKTAEWFEDPLLSPYMSFALHFKADKKALVPAVVHLDGTGRLQTVNKELSPWFHQFLIQWEALSGVPILVNTSFNDSEPIVETPEDAVRCFLKTGLDLLYFYDFGILVEK